MTNTAQVKSVSEKPEKAPKTVQDYQNQLAGLDIRLGKDQGAQKERARCKARIEALLAEQALAQKAAADAAAQQAQKKQARK